VRGGSRAATILKAPGVEGSAPGANQPAAFSFSPPATFRKGVGRSAGARHSAPGASLLHRPALGVTFQVGRQMLLTDELIANMVSDAAAMAKRFAGVPRSPLRG
jgi:hypothetical protein